MSLLLLFRPSVGAAGDQNVTHAAPSLLLVGGTHAVNYSGEVAATPGILALAGGTHAVEYGGSVTATPGILLLVGGTHTTTQSGSVDATAGILLLSGGTHTPDNGVVAENRERLKVGSGQ